MQVSKEELAARRDDNGEFYVTIHCMGAIFRLYKPITVNDIIEAAKKVQRMDDSSITTKTEFIAMHRGFHITGNVQRLGLPKGALIEVKPLESTYVRTK